MGIMRCGNLPVRAAKSINHADRDWKDAVCRPAARQVGFLRALIESRPFFRRIPDQSMIAGEAGRPGCISRRRAIVKEAMPSSTSRNAIRRATIDLGSLRSKELRAWWFDPRTGIGTQIERRIGGRQEFVSPPFGPDWVLVVEDAKAGYEPPGLASIRV